MVKTKNVNVALPDAIATYIKSKANEGYLSYSAVARQYLIRAITEELVLKYQAEGYSYSRIAEMAETSVTNVMEILSRYMSEDETPDLDDDLKEIGGI